MGGVEIIVIGMRKNSLSITGVYLFMFLVSAENKSCV
jgi:hypothetical protein